MWVSVEEERREQDWEKSSGLAYGPGKMTIRLGLLMSGGSQSGEGPKLVLGVLVTHRVGKTAGRYSKMIKCYFGFDFGSVHRGWEEKKKEFGEQTPSRLC